jgi:hypothetical protein
LPFTERSKGRVEKISKVYIASIANSITLQATKTDLFEAPKQRQSVRAGKREIIRKQEFLIQERLVVEFGGGGEL